MTLVIRSFDVLYFVSLVTYLLPEKFVVFLVTMLTLDTLDVTLQIWDVPRCYCNFGTGVFGKHNYSGFDRASWTLRTNKRHRDDVNKTLKCSSKSERDRKESEVGCRYSSLLQLPYFDAVRMLIIDPMHNMYLGTAKTIFNKVWLQRGIVDATGLRKINDRIQSWFVPPEVQFSRLPPIMEHSSSLTAEQWMIWVNYYSLNCLYEVIPFEHLECWRRFVLASRLLCKRQLTAEDIQVADTLLLKFCRQFELIYGPEAVTPNMHLHAHVADCIRDYKTNVFYLGVRI